MQPFRAIIRSTDLDAFVEWNQANDWENELVQLSAGRGLYESKVLAFLDYLVFRVRSGPRLMRTYTVPNGTVVFGFARAETSGIWSGVELPRVNMTVHWPGQTYYSIPPENTAIYCFQIPLPLAQQWGYFENPAIAATTIPERACANAVNGIADHFLDQIDLILDSPDNQRDSYGMGSTGWHDHELLLTGLQQVLDLCFPNETEDRGIQALAKSSLIDNARDLIACQLDDQLTAAELATTLGVSRRVLERSFQEVLQMSPYQYVMIQKMHAVRRILKTGDSSVLDACMAYGFENAGRFAGKFAKHFGELPSETLHHGNKPPKSATRRPVKNREVSFAQ